MRTSLFLLPLVMALLFSVAVEAQPYRGVYLKPLGETALDANPSSIVVDEGGNRIYVGVEHEIVVIDGWSDKIIQEIPLGFDVEVIKFSERNGRLYVAGSGSSNVTVIDSENGQIIGYIKDYVAGSYAIAIDPNTNRVYIGHATIWQGWSDKVYVYDADTFAEMASISIPGSGEPTTIQKVGVAVNPSTNTIFVTWSYDDTVLVYDGRDYNLTVSKNDLPSFSMRVFVNPSTSHAHIGDLTLDEMLNPIEGVEPVSSDDIKAHIPSLNLLVCSTSYRSLDLLNGENNEKVSSIDLENSIDDVAVNSVTEKIYVINRYYPAVSVVSFGLDMVSPSVEITSPGKDSLLGVDSFVVGWTGSDKDSGIEHYEVRLDDGEWKNVGLEGTQAFTDVSDGDRVISIRAFDFARNIDEEAIHVFVDTTPPYINFLTPGDGETVKSTEVTAKWTGWDNYKGIEHFEIRIDNEPWVDKGVSEEHTFAHLAEGTHKLTLKGFDLAGLTSEASITFIVNLSLIGGPGWIDDIIVFLAIILAIAGLALVLRRRLGRRAPASRRHAFPPSAFAPLPNMHACLGVLSLPEMRCKA